jgi:hypothetical protein
MLQNKIQSIKKNILFFILIGVSTNAMSQKLCLNDIINKAYGSKVVLGTDSLLYILSECSPFIEIRPKKGDNIQLVVFKNKEHLIKDLSYQDSYLLKVNLSDVFSNRLFLIIGVYKINNETFTNSSNFLIFHDERKIECVFNDKKEWIYNKTINVKKHLTD